LEGMVVFAELPPLPAEQYAWRAYFEERNNLIDRLTELSPLMVILLDRSSQDDLQYFSANALEPSALRRERTAAAVPVTMINGPGAIRFYDEMKEGSAAATLIMHLAKPRRAQRQLRNVIGLLRGSDPELQDTYIFLTAHYDGTGPATGAPPGIVWNAANDNGSGVASIVESAAALAALPEKPRRSLVFMAFFGEEQGLLGASFYGAHPVLPQSTSSRSGERIVMRGTRGGAPLLPGSIIRKSERYCRLRASTSGSPSIRIPVLPIDIFRSATTRF
jgi:hypothetical protein